MSTTLYTKRQQGAVLFLCVSVLALLSILAITFTNRSLMEMHAAANSIHALQAKFLALAGVEYCNCRLREEASQIARDPETWEPTNKKSTFHFWDWQCPEKTDNWFSDSLENLKLPSYCQILLKSSKEYGKTGREFYIGQNPSFYTCRVVDTNSLININGEYSEVLQKTLQKLFEELKIGNAAKIAEDIIKKRKESYYTSLDDVQIALEIEQDVWDKISPYLCTESAQEEIFDPETKELQKYYPVNINAAPREVLMAIFSGLEGKTFEDNRTVSLSEEKVKKLVDAILEGTPRCYFLSWENFAKFLESLPGFSPEEIALIFSNACPFVLPNHQNPEKHVKWAIDRSQLTKYNIPCTLYPGGFFSIESIGTYVEVDVQGKSKVSMTMQIFSQFTHRTQEDFHSNRIISDVAGDILQATTGPNPIGHLLAQLEGKDSVTEKTTPNKEIKPHKLNGWIFRANGFNNEASMHFKGDESSYPEGFDIQENFETNYCDGKKDPVYLSPPLVEEPRGQKVSLSFFFKPGDLFDPQNTTPIFRNFSLDEGIATEIYWDAAGYLRAARTLCCSKDKEYPDPEPRQSKMKIYKGILKPDGFLELSKIGLQLYKENLDSWSVSIGLPPIGSISYSEIADPSFAAEFGYVFATKIYRALAQGLCNKDELPITMKYSSLTLTIFLYPIVLPPFVMPVPVPVVVNGLERTLVISLSEYLDVVFQNEPEIFEVERPADQLSLRNVSLHFIPPFPHPNPVSRSEFRIEKALEKNIWYRIHLLWDGMEIKQFALSDVEGTISGKDIPEMCDTPLNVWRITDITMEHQIEFSAPGTYVYTEKLDVARFKNSCFQAKFKIPEYRNPQYGNMVVTKFLPNSSKSKNLCEVYACLYSDKKNKWYSNYSTQGGLVKEILQDSTPFPQAEYLLFLSGNLYETPIVPEVRLRILHETLYKHCRIFGF